MTGESIVACALAERNAPRMLSVTASSEARLASRSDVLTASSIVSTPPCCPSMSGGRSIGTPRRLDASSRCGVGARRARVATGGAHRLTLAATGVRRLLRDLGRRDDLRHLDLVHQRLRRRL